MFDIEEVYNFVIYYVDWKKKVFIKIENGLVDDDIVIGYINYFSEYMILNFGENNKLLVFLFD